jgi:hypothetical protein
MGRKDGDGGWAGGAGEREILLTWSWIAGAQMRVGVTTTMSASAVLLSLENDKSNCRVCVYHRIAPPSFFRPDSIRSSSAV